MDHRPYPGRAINGQRVLSTAVRWGISSLVLVMAWLASAPPVAATCGRFFLKYNEDTRRYDCVNQPAQTGEGAAGRRARNLRADQDQRDEQLRTAVEQQLRGIRASLKQRLRAQRQRTDTQLRVQNARIQQLLARQRQLVQQQRNLTRQLRATRR